MRPAIPWAGHVDSQMLRMTRTNEFEYTAVRQPPTFASLGEFGLACAPIICFSSVSTPSSPGCLDSVDPRCTNQTVASTYSVNWRYSDCQFSITSAMNDDDVT